MAPTGRAKLLDEARSARRLGLAALVLCAAATSGWSRARDWEDIDLPRGFGLELASGLVSNRPASEGGALVYEGGALRSAAGLRVLESSPEEGARLSIARGEGRPAPEVGVVRGLELGFDLGEAGFGYLRVLESTPERVRLEFALERGSAAEVLARHPARVEARSGEDRVELAWDDAPAAAVGYRVERRALDRGMPGEWELVAASASSPFVDLAPPSGVVLEYRVGPAGEGAGFGSRARAAAGLLPEEQPIRLARGLRLDLLTGAADSARDDLMVEFVGNNGAQLAAGLGVGLRVLNPIEATQWELPGPEDGGYRDQRFFLTDDRALAVHLPEGLFARVRIEVAEGGETSLYRQLDLSGARAFPAPPDAPAASWEAGRGVVLRLPAASSTPGPAAGYVVEREEAFQGGDWRAVAELDDAAEEWLDTPDAARTLVRYRLRHVIEGGKRSLAGPPATVLLGDDGGPGTALLLASALAEIAHPEFERRLHAEGVLTALGARAWPELRELLSAEDPEAVAAARRILARTAAREPDAAGGEASGEAPELAPVILRARGRAEGLGEPPDGWLADRPDGRAIAILRDSGARLPPGAEAWRDLIASDDPDPGVRLVASVIGSWPSARRDGPAAFEPSPAAIESSFDLAALASGVADGAGARRELEARLDASDPWACFVRLQLLHALELARGDAALEADWLERAALGASLLERRAIDDPGDVFLAAALEVVEDPSVRLRAAMNLADLRLRRATGPAGGDGDRPRRVVVLPAADAELLIAELETLRDAAPEDVDLVLPPGAYALADGRQGVAVAARGLRILGEGRPVLHFGFVVMRDSDVVLEGLHLAPSAGSAINVDRAACLLRDCTIAPPVLAAQATDGVLELDRVQVQLAPDAPPLAGGIRMGRLSLLLARESRLAAGSGALSGARTAYVERCVLDGGERSAIDGRIDGEVLLLDSFVRARTEAIGNVYAGAFEGAILAAGERAAQNLGARLVVCPAHALHVGPPGEWQDARRAERCLIGR